MRTIPGVVALSACLHANDVTGDGGVAPAGECAGDVAITVHLEPGEEATRCVDLGADAPRAITRVRSRLRGAWHHLSVYRSRATADRAEPYPCTPFDVAVNPPILISQLPDETLELPGGVAFVLQPGERVRLEMHAFNAGTAGADACGAVWLDPAAGATPQAADFFFYANGAVTLPPGQPVTVGPAWLEVPAGWNVFAMTGHTHRWGTRVLAEIAPSADAPGRTVYDTRDGASRAPSWEVAAIDPPFTTAAGEGLRFSCDFENGSAQTVTFGPTARSEMCGMYGYYFPSQGYRVCMIHFGDGGPFCCPAAGDPRCAGLNPMP